MSYENVNYKQIFNQRRDSEKIDSLARHFNPDQIREFAVFLKEQGHKEWGIFVLQNQRNIEKLSAHYLLKQKSGTDNLNDMTISGLQGSSILNSNDLNKETKTEKPDGMCAGFKANIADEDFLVKTDRGYSGGDSAPSGYTQNEYDEMLAVKEAYAAELYTFMTGQTFIDYKLLLSPNDEDNKRVAIASKWVENAEKVPEDYLQQIENEPEKKIQYLEMLISSLVLGDNDVHTGNMIKVNNYGEDEVARIDFGCALGYNLSTSLDEVTPEVISNYYNQANSINSISSDFFTQDEINEACNNIVNRVQEDKDKLSEIGARYEPILERYHEQSIKAGADNTKFSSIYENIESRVDTLKEMTSTSTMRRSP